mmetsp:Transcript_23164/g.28427  ORF Transcript_23164/g.28427 Transcript_23164/m.28427 type:complete len:260 (+) Transcript_23164:1945-2724(+)
MRLPRNTPQTHSTSCKPLHNLFRRLNVIQRNTLRRIILKLQLTTQRHFLILFIHSLGKLLISLPRISPSGDLKVRNPQRMVQMSFSAVAVMQLTVVLDQWGGFIGARGVAFFVEAFEIAVESFKISSLDTGCGASEASIDNFVGQPDCLKHLRTLIALQRGNSHLTHDLKHSLGSSLAIITNNFFVTKHLITLRLHQPLRIHLTNGLIRHIWTNPVTTKSKHSHKIMHLLTISRLGKNSRLRTLLRPQQMLMHRSHSHE